MRRFLPRLNLCGVLALLVLCVVQWRHDSRLNVDLDRVARANLQKESRLVEQSNIVTGLNEDLNRFKTSLTNQQARTAQLEVERSALQLTNSQLAAECGQLKTAVTNWAGAVTRRDHQIQEANSRINELAANLNDSVRKFNALVTNYNSVVKDLNALRTQSTNAAAK